MIKLSNVFKYYNRNKENEVIAINNVSIEISKSETIAIMGRSGAGKSTLLHIISCIDNIDDGVYRLNNIDISPLTDKKISKIRNEKVGIVLQDFSLIENETALFNVTVPLYFTKCSFTDMKKKAQLVLKKVGMEKLLNRNVNEMSGGQKQRVAIARAIVNNPDVLLADEPTGALDSKTAKEILSLLVGLSRFGTTVIIVTHDITIANMCNRLINIEDGKIINID